MMNYKSEWLQDNDNDTFYEIDLLHDKPIYFDTSIHPQMNNYEEEREEIHKAPSIFLKDSPNMIEDNSSTDHLSYLDLTSPHLEVSEISWKKLYEDHLSRNNLIQKEIDSLHMYMGFRTETITIEEQFLSVQEKKDPTLFEVKKQTKNLFELPLDEFNARIVTEFPNAMINKVKMANEKRKEAIGLLREYSSKISKVHKDCIEKLIATTSKDESMNEAKKKEIVNMFYNNFKCAKDMIRNLIDEEIRKLIEKSVKGRNRPLPENSKQILKDWFLEHFKHPYPNDKEKEDIMESTGLTKTQVNNWFINKRVRVWRPLIKKLFPDCHGLLKANKEKMYLNKCQDIEKLSTRLEKSL